MESKNELVSNCIGFVPKPLEKRKTKKMLKKDKSKEIKMSKGKKQISTQTIE